MSVSGAPARPRIERKIFHARRANELQTVRRNREHAAARVSRIRQNERERPKAMTTSGRTLSHVLTFAISSWKASLRSTCCPYGSSTSSCLWSCHVSCGSISWRGGAWTLAQADIRQTVLPTALSNPAVLMFARKRRLARRAAKPPIVSKRVVGSSCGSPGRQLMREANRRPELVFQILAIVIGVQRVERGAASTVPRDPFQRAGSRGRWHSRKPHL
jgi:hypothetical protein